MAGGSSFERNTERLNDERLRNVCCSNVDGVIVILRIK